MKDKIILGVLYSAIMALGWWLVIDIDGTVATIGGGILILFGAAGMAGMARFG